MFTTLEVSQKTQQPVSQSFPIIGTRGILASVCSTFCFTQLRSKLMNYATSDYKNQALYPQLSVGARKFLILVIAFVVS